ncbi:energy-coupling factor ABC transporter ATP-binding protein [Salinigranum halophilum]|uniref:energy-coupling factor ABC transporter ATP-binding protein n=1 Tax=Salinigranum halophilum TaxID=2565931 RepID=UPI00115E2EB8|nr:ABC transporter ATP-binding protein [Salinigranum halophilum]
MTAPVLCARDLRYEYPDGTVGLAGVDLTVEAGERVAITGPNGSGKSTLLSVLGGLVDPADGRVEYFGETENAEAVRERLGVLLQDPDDYLFNTTVSADIEYGPAQLGVPREEADRRVNALADALDLDGLLDKPPHRLSGGEKKRAALASVLSFDPSVLLLDEPTSAVDAPRTADVLALLDRRHRAGATLVTVTPDVELIPRVADRVVVVGPSGDLVADGPVAEVLTDPETLTTAGLQPPAVVRLFDRLGWDDPPVDVDDAVERLETTGLPRR